MTAEQGSFLSEKEVLKSLWRGEKPLVSPADWKYKQLYSMRTNYFQMEVPWAYVTCSPEEESLKDKKGVVSIPSLPHAYMKQVKAFDAVAHAAGLSNYAFAGYDELEEGAQVKTPLVLTPSHFAGWEALVDYAEELYNDPSLNGRVIVIQNEDGFWDPTIDGLDLRRFVKTDGVQGTDGGLFVTKDASETVSLLKNILGDDVSRVPQKKTREKILIGSDVLLSTGNNKKIPELGRSTTTAGGIIRTRPYNIILGKPGNAKEESFSCIGNNEEKQEKVLTQISGGNLSVFETELRNKGADPDSTYVLFDDRGLDILVLDDNGEVDYEKSIALFRDTEAFKPHHDILNLHKPGPGAELANLLKRIPLREFYSLVRDAAQELGISEDRIYADDIQTYTSMRFRQDDYNNPESKVFHSVVSNKVHFDPVIPEGAPLTSECYMSLAGPENPEGKRNIELPDYFEKLSPMARAVETMAAYYGFDKHQEEQRQNPSVSFAHAAGDKPLTIALSSNKNISEMRKEFPGFRIITLDDEEYSYTRAASTGESTIAVMERFMADADIFFWPPQHSQSSSNNKHFIKGNALFDSMFVGKQIFDPNVHGKLALIIRNGGSSACEHALQRYFHQYDLGLVGDKLSDMVTLVHNMDEVHAAIEKWRPTYLPTSSTPIPSKEWGTPPDYNYYGITVYASATKENDEANDPARLFSACAAVLGFPLANGGGAEGTMRASSAGYHEGRALLEENRHAFKNGRIPYNHISSIQCFDTYHLEGGIFENDYNYVASTIAEREEILGRSLYFINKMGLDMTRQALTDEVSFSGGIGSNKEKDSSFLSRLYVPPAMQTVYRALRPFTLVNQLLHGKRVYEEHDKMLAEGIRRKTNILVEDDWQSALYEVIEARRNAGLEPAGLNYDLLRDPCLGLDECWQDRMIKEGKAHQKLINPPVAKHGMVPRVA